MTPAWDSPTAAHGKAAVAWDTDVTDCPATAALAALGQVLGLAGIWRAKSGCIPRTPNRRFSLGVSMPEGLRQR
jgi:hypothetical protein